MKYHSIKKAKKKRKKEERKHALDQKATKKKRKKSSFLNRFLGWFHGRELVFFSYFLVFFYKKKKKRIEELKTRSRPRKWPRNKEKYVLLLIVFLNGFLVESLFSFSFSYFLVFFYNKVSPLKMSSFQSASLCQTKSQELNFIEFGLVGLRTLWGWWWSGELIN